MTSKAVKRRRSREYNMNYIQGNIVENVAFMPEEVNGHRGENHIAIKKNRDKAIYMNFGYLVFLTGALIFAAVTLCSYIQLQSEITNQVKEISSLESQYNTLKLSNDEEYNTINSSIDLEKIKAIAIGELGMTYADQGQIVQVQGNNQDYVHQVADLPDDSSK